MLIYVGKSYLHGVPARNLTDEEVEQYGKSWLLSTGLYKEQSKPKAAENKAASGAQENKKDGE